jgi:hypothetical protein
VYGVKPVNLQTGSLLSQRAGEAMLAYGYLSFDPPLLPFLSIGIKDINREDTSAILNASLGNPD